jgi:uncharacterized membrane protein YdbT with pleckstrin-like domain
MDYVQSLLAENEVIVIQTRQHWMVWAKSFLLNAILLIAIVALAVSVTFALVPLAGMAVACLAILPIGSFVRSYLIWWNEEYLVTNRRVIQAEGIVNKHVIDSSLEKVNDVVLDQSFLGRILDYGDIEILTASEGGVNKLDKIAAPVKFKTEMLNQKETLGMDEPLAARGDRRGDIPVLIAELDALRARGILTDAEFQQKKAELLSRI